MLATTFPAGGRTRLAPTPSGFLHAGNAFNFLVTARLARIMGSTIILRIDDLDTERMQPEFLDDIFFSLEWLGIQWNEGPSGPEAFNAAWSQQFRTHRYLSLVDELQVHGAIYPCSCSRIHFEERQRAGAPHLCRTAPKNATSPGTPWRLIVPDHAEVAIRQLNNTAEQVGLATLMPDPIILQRVNGRPAYQVASLSDDLDMGISMVVRGADLLPSTACQHYIAQVLGRQIFPEVCFHHHPLSLDAAGQKLSKSAGAGSLKAMREAGVSAAPLVAAAEGYVDGLLNDIKA